MTTLLVVLAAGIGAVCRYAVDRLVTGHSGHAFPTGTLTVNVTGSLLLGLVAGWSAHGHLGGTATSIAGAGFAGGYTTLSTWAWETVALAEAGEATLALLNALGSTAVCLAAAAAGIALAST